MPSEGLRSKSVYFCLESQPVKLFTVSGTKLTAKPQQETKVFSHTACLCVCGALPKIRLHVSDALGHGGRHPNFSMLVMRALCSLMKPGLLPSCLLLPTVCWAGVSCEFGQRHQMLEPLTDQRHLSQSSLQTAPLSPAGSGLVILMKMRERK